MTDNDAMRHDVIVIGAGLAGLYMLHKLRQTGRRAIVIEAGSDVGGTWYWNRYPGARCDVESLDYQYTFSDALQREWTWSERFARQDEILAYINHVADRFDLRRDIVFDTRVTRARFVEAATEWEVEADDGSHHVAPFLIAATGALSLPQTPPLPGIDDFKGDVYHTGRWPHDGVDFTARRVAVVGTGSSGIQAIPNIAAQAERLYVFQRTPNFSLPARNAPLTEQQVEERRRNFADIARSNKASPSGLYRPPSDVATRSALDVPEEQRAADYEKWWDRGGTLLMRTYTDLLIDADSNRTATAFAQRKIRDMVERPDVADKLTPHYHIGTKRICLDSGYYETFNRPNVTLVDVNEDPISTITGDAIVTAGRTCQVDAIVFATGYDAMTGPLLAMDITGRGGRTMREAWSDGPRTYLGLSIAGFPNLFVVAGPGSPSVLANVILSIEQHVDWIADCLDHMRDRGFETIEASPDAQDAWVEHVNEVAQATLYPRTKSWYSGSNIAGKPEIFMPYVGGLGRYTAHCTGVARDGYAGFVLS